MRIIVEIKNTEGHNQNVELTVVNPKIKTLLAGLTYTDGHLVKLAKGAALTAEDLKESTALRAISQETALEMVIDAFKNGSTNIVESAEPLAEENGEEAEVEAETQTQGTSIQIPTAEEALKRAVKK